MKGLMELKINGKQDDPKMDKNRKIQKKRQQSKKFIRF